MNTKETVNKGLKRAYECTIAAAEVDAAIEQELKRVGGKVKIAGFRPGKVPAKILEQRYGKAVQEDVVRHLITNGVTDAIKDNKLRPALQPKLDEDEYERGEDLKFKFELEILPDVPEIDYGKVKVERETFEISDEDIDCLLYTSPSPRDS